MSNSRKEDDCTNKNNNANVIKNKNNDVNPSTMNSTYNMNDGNMDLLSSDFLHALATQLSNVKKLKQDNNNADVNHAMAACTSLLTQ